MPKEIQVKKKRRVTWILNIKRRVTCVTLVEEGMEREKERERER